MEEKVNKNELVDVISERAMVSKKDAKNVIEETFALIKEAMLRGEEVNIKNFAVFVPKTRKSRDGTHPSSHEIITIPETKTIVLRLSKGFKKELNK